MKAELFENVDTGIAITNHLISLTESSSSKNPKWPGVVAFSNSFGVVWTGPHCNFYAFVIGWAQLKAMLTGNFLV